MKVVADLHLHSPYSRAVSKNMTFDVLAQKGREKGLSLLGTGDFTHPKWIEEIKKKLSDNGNGIYGYDNMSFLLSNEISLVYTQEGKGRRIHYIILSPDLETTEQINQFLRSKGRVDYDGRPIFGFSSIELADRLMKISSDIEIIPSHAWTPWFGIFGSMSGFDSLKECFGEKAKHIHAIETGLSSDPAMNWRCSFLDNITLLSNSDSHSPYPHRLGREANVFEMKELTYKNVIEAIRKNKLEYTIETSPDYGKYHYDGHRLCNISMAPGESKKHKNMCPKCGKPLTIGVLNRVEQLADRKEGEKPKGSQYKTLIPLMEVIALSVGQQVFTKKVQQVYSTLLAKFSNELAILLDAPESEIKKAADEKLTGLIMKNRAGQIEIIPGYDGVYGRPVINSISGDSGTEKASEKSGLRKFL